MGIFAAIVVLGVLIFVHELGHFLIAKLCGVGVLEFAVGFGPPLLRWQGKETTYSLRAVPLGGFVRMAGDDPSLVYGDSSGEANQSDAAGASPIEGVQEDLTSEQQALLRDESRWFLKKPYLPRCAIVLAGPGANFLFAWVLAFASYLIVGLPTIVDGPVTIGGIQKGLPAEAAGLKTGDKVVSVDGRVVNSFSALVEIVQGSGGKLLEFVVLRPKNGASTATTDTPDAQEQLSIQVKPLSDASPELDVLEGRTVNQTFRIGVTPAIDNLSYAKVGVVDAAFAGAGQVVQLSLQTVRVLKGLVTGLLSPSRTIGGPIEIIKQTADSANRGTVELVFMMIMLNVTLAVMNLLPIPVLDGGHLTFFTLEKLRGKPLSMRAQAAVMNVGLLIILSLMVFAVGNDLRRAFS